MTLKIGLVGASLAVAAAALLAPGPSLGQILGPMSFPPGYIGPIPSPIPPLIPPKPRSGAAPKSPSPDVQAGDGADGGCTSECLAECGCALTPDCLDDCVAKKCEGN